ncbi:MAG: glycosyltransferase family 2 protein [Gomphosphaeria aponina SAG 52.96 = DSM 107014]|uniref:Glycosyltransferase family 2 protein n=1 Tax=Gomphosphaeria aponina SAG 52.96 = DSM 107014 TaxID=1521640 RepID=A0A941GNM7_9CHRO|nr:glycosyltransferase family 2 protein [Gomphosphaeria aponina SAG 52.96 = DSM 107014]
MLNTPVAFIIFNRPDLTQIIFNAIRQEQPKQLFVIADGPRFPEELDKCQKARDVIKQVDWDCEVFTNYADTNLGCRQRVSSGLDWVFEQVEEAIILEDDCLPHPDFFRFCQELLEKYRNDTRIMQIGGNNSLCATLSPNHSFSYYFSGLPHIWGWATWKRSWNLYDTNMSLWTHVRDYYPAAFEIFGDRNEIEKRKELLNQVFNGSIDTWAYIWLLTFISQHGLSILPQVNLISNIGFRDDATHTTQKNSFRANLPIESIDFPLKHPNFIIRDSLADDKYLEPSREKNVSLIRRIKQVVKKIINWG